MKPGRVLLLLGAAGGMVMMPSGCVVASAVGAAGELAATTVVVAGKTATTVVKTTGKIAGSAIRGSGSLTATGIESLAKLAVAGMVTFVDVTTGVIVRVPWREGMTLYAGGELAQVQLAERSIDLVRGGRLVYAAARHARSDLPLASGDVVRLAAHVAPRRV